MSIGDKFIRISMAMKNRKLQVLIAESEPEVRQAILGAIEGHYSARVVNTAEDARAALYAGGYFLAFIGERVEGLSAGEALQFVREKNLPVCVIAVFTRQNPTRDAELIEQGAVAVVTYPFHPKLLRALAGQAMQNVIGRLQVSSMLNRLRMLYLTILGFDCPGMGNTEAVSAMAETDVPIILIGERGTGKELLARAIHLAGRRAMGPFEVVNARRVSGEEQGNTLFGDEDNPGAIEKAKGGALLIHGVGEIPMPMQERLLGIINDERSNVRFMFTTRIDLHGAALRGEFSPDLWVMLDANSFNVPALRERPEAIPILARRLLDQYCERLSSPARNLHSTARDLLVSHSWPGNLLELEKVIILGAARASGPLLVADDLLEIQPLRDSALLDQLSLEEILAHKLRPLVSTVDEIIEADLHDLVVSRVEKPLLRMVMEKVGGNQIKAARALGLHRNTLRKKLQQLGIKPKGDR